jgi:hypothetical protein
VLAAIVLPVSAAPGFTVIVKYCDGPEQPFAVGFIVIVATTFAFVVFRAVKAGILPLPAPARPIETVLFVQL